MFYETLKLGIQAIRRNVLRSFLTLLGIVIGVGAVIAMVTIGNGTTAKVSADMAKLGSNLLFIRPGQFGPGRSADVKPFTMRDVTALKNQLHGIKAVAPVSQKSVTIVHGSESRNVSVIGTDNAYFIAQDRPLKEGRKFLDGELRSGRAVCIIGKTVQKELFTSMSVIGRRIRVDKISCEVIGLLTVKGESSFGRDKDDTILLPIRTYHRRIAGSTDVGRIYVSAKDGVATSKVQADIEALLRERRDIVTGKKTTLALLI